MKSGLIVLATLLSFIGWNQNANSWVRKNDFSGFKREQAAAFSIGNRGYVCTGVDTSETVLSDLWEYDPDLDTWTQKANMPGGGRRSAFAFAVNGKGYVGTGINVDEATFGVPLFDFWEYNPLNNIWTQRANFPGAGGVGVYYATAFAADNKGFVCGGKIAPSYYTNELWEYKPSLDQWTMRTPFPGGGRYNMSSLSVNNIGYVGLGTDQDAYRCDWWQYHPGTNNWTQKSDFIGGNRGGASTFTSFNKGYVCLGTNGGLKDDLFIYDPVNDHWYPRANYGGSERKQAISFTIGNRAFVGLGSGVSGKKVSMYEYISEEFLSLQESNVQVLVYPNPTTDRLTISSDNEKLERLIIHSETGELLMEQTVDKNTTTLDVSGLSNGNYYCELIGSSTTVIHFQITGK